MMNFADIRQDNYYYVDKTRFIPMIEEADRSLSLLLLFFLLHPSAPLRQEPHAEYAATLL